MPVQKNTFNEMVNKSVKPFPKNTQVAIRTLLEGVRPLVEAEINKREVRKLKKKQLTPLEKVRYCQARPQPLTHPARPRFLNYAENCITLGYKLPAAHQITLDKIYNEVLSGD